MKTTKFSIFMCIALAFYFYNANAQKPLVELHDNFIWGITPGPELPCLTESISGNIAFDGFFTNSSFEAGVKNYTYHESAEGVLMGETSGEYEMSWNFNQRETSFDDGFPKHFSGMALSSIRQDGKLFMTIKWQFKMIWNEPWTPPIVWREVFNPECK
jgi:hypothetical protein